jgi:hypothetical protein
VAGLASLALLSCSGAAAPPILMSSSVPLATLGSRATVGCACRQHVPSAPMVPPEHTLGTVARHALCPWTGAGRPKPAPAAPMPVRRAPARQFKRAGGSATMGARSSTRSLSAGCRHRLRHFPPPRRSALSPRVAEGRTVATGLRSWWGLPWLSSHDDVRFGRWVDPRPVCGQVAGLDLLQSRRSSRPSRRPDDLAR